ncbi:hypothetical protein, partial [Breoghania sp. JC706]|uniref:hypothetical protein n=1 Tax=Breoghania sp. JC706 TaxID=3117732 RepID=UPI00300837DF
EAYARLVDNPIYTKMNMEGRSLGSDLTHGGDASSTGASVENLVKYYERGAVAEYLIGEKKLYRAARKAGKWKGRRRAFTEAVAYAARRGDVDPNGNEFVSEAAQLARQKIFDPLLKRMQELRILPQDLHLDTALSYVTRVYDRPKIIARASEFKAIVRRHVSGAVRKAQERQEEIRIARTINKATDLDDELARAHTRLKNVEGRLEKRKSVRARKVDLIRKEEGKRLDVLRDRVPRSVLDVAKSTRHDDAIMKDVARVGRARPSRARYPILGILKAHGGVHADSDLAAELRHMGVTHKTVPGLLRKEKGLRDIDNLVAGEDPLLARMSDPDSGYVDRDEVLAAIRDELGGNPLREGDELAEEAARDALEQNVEHWLDSIGLSPNASVKEVRQYLDNAVRAEHQLTDLDKRIAAMNRDLEDFDRLTDDVAKEQTIAGASADKLADELNELEARINEVRQYANGSRRVSILVDYADARKGLEQVKARQSRLGKRIEELEAVPAGKVTPEIAAELRALRHDKIGVDERVIKGEAKVEKLKPYLPKDAGDDLDFISPEDFNEYVNEIVNSIYDNVTGNGQGDMPQWLTPATRGPLKGRLLRIPDVELEGFLVSDMDAITRHYARTAGAEVELTSKFGRADMRDQFKALDDEYHQKLDAAKTEAERKSLTKAFERDQTNLAAFRDMIRGTYRSAEQNSNWGRLTRAALTFNYMRLLGGVALSSLSDLSRSVAVHGVRATMRDGVPILVSRLKAAKISRADARALGAVTETVLQSRLAQLAELTDPYAYGSTFERFLSNSSNVFSRLTFLGAWNDTMKTMAAVMTQNRIMRNALRPGAMSREERAYMAYLGFDEDMTRRIAAQFRTHGVREKNVYGANVEAWDDDVARRAFAAALNKDVDRTIVTKGVADTPLWTHSNWGKVVTQFQSFALASHQRVLIAGLQERPHRLAEQMVFSTALGMLVSWAKYKERGDDDRAERLLDNPGEWIANGLDRSGLLAIPFQISNTMDKIGVSHAGPVPLTITSALQTAAGDRDTGGTVSRYASRNSMGALFGPSVGLVQDLVTIASQTARGEVDRQGAKAMLRLVPGGTLPGARTLLNTKVRPALENAVE